MHIIEIIFNHISFPTLSPKLSPPLCTDRHPQRRTQKIPALACPCSSVPRRAEEPPAVARGHGYHPRSSPARCAPARVPANDRRRPCLPSSGPHSLAVLQLARRGTQAHAAARRERHVGQEGAARVRRAHPDTSVAHGNARGPWWQMQGR